MLKNLKKEVLIFADNREFNSSVVKELALMNCVVKPKQLEVADYLLSERVGVERKGQQDFISSIFDQRLFNQLKNLKQSFERPVLIIEGSSLYSIRNIHPNAVRGALASIAIDYKIPILWTLNEKDTASILFWIAKREQIEEEKYISIRGERKPLTLKERQEFLVAGLPDINYKLGRRLLNFFKNPEEIFTAPPEELMKVPGIGEKTAKKIRKIITEKYGG